MMKKCFLVPAMLSLGLLLLASDSAHAQRRGYVNDGNYGGLGDYVRQYLGVGDNYGRVYNNGAYYNNPYNGGYYNNPYNSGYYGNPYNSGYYGNSYNPAPYRYTAPHTSYYQDPAPVVPIQYVPVAADSALVRILLRDPLARVWMSGSPTQQTGTDRVFSTLPLTPGYSYSYRIRATWIQGGREVTQEQVVSVIPGQTTVADFR